MEEEGEKLFFAGTSNLVKNAPIIAVIGAVLFFVVAHPFIFEFVDSIFEKVVGDNTQRDLLVFIHSVVFGGLMFGSVYLIDYLKILD
tara:strand:- start:485 stop:745 length:261 start_codon:yes stop_codon:yes gene_type:complete